MKVQDVAKMIMRERGITQAQLAEKFGKAGQSTISMILNGRSMKVENLLMILDECGYEMVIRDRGDAGHEYIVGDVHAERMVVKRDEDERLRQIVEDVVSKKLKEYRKADRAAERRKMFEEMPNDIQAGKVNLPLGKDI